MERGAEKQWRPWAGGLYWGDAAGETKERVKRMDRKPFAMVVMGDSILWGQGLYPAEKIHARVADGLRQRGMTVTARLLAHSGAVIGTPENAGEAVPLGGAYGGEVPVGNPTVFEQAQAALKGAAVDAETDLVLVGGGINDVDIGTLVNPLDVRLDERIEEAFYRRMKLLLEKVYHDFPNAVIVVTGYYVFFSDYSEANLAQAALKALGFNVPVMPERVSDQLLDLFITDRLIERFEHFYDYSEACLQRALRELTEAVPEMRARVFYADPKFKPEHAIGAPESLLFGINADLSPQDPAVIAEGRARACEEHAAKLNPVQQLACPRATVGHPNPAGAQRYADAIMQQVRYALPALFVDG